jgi:hypothetical protein
MVESVAVLIFGAVVIIAEVVAMIWRGRGWGPLSSRITGLSLIVIGTVFLAVSKVSSDRLSAAYRYLEDRTDKKTPDD